MDGIISENSRKALEAVSSRFVQLQAQLALVHDAQLLAAQDESIQGAGRNHSAVVMREPLARGYKKLVEASIQFDETASTLKEQICGEVGTQIQALLSDEARQGNVKLTPKNLAATLNDETKQDIRTYLVIRSIGNMMHEALNANPDDLGFGMNAHCLYFDELFREAVQPKEVTQRRHEWRASLQRPTYSLERAFVQASEELQSDIIRQLEQYGWGKQQRDVMKQVGIAGLLGAAGGAATVMGMSDPASWMATIMGVFGGGVVAAGGYGLHASINAGRLPKDMIAHVHGADLAQVSVEAA
ncbi:MAG: hypothetical protein ACOYNL_11495, partial [Rickettsiales bacterium]